MLPKLLAIAFAVTSYNLFFFGNYPPLPGTVGTAVILIAFSIFTLTAFFPSFLKLRKKHTLAIITLILAAAGISVFRANYLDRFTLSFTALGLNLVLLYLLASRSPTIRFLSEIFITPVILAFGWLASTFRLGLTTLPNSLARTVHHQSANPPKLSTKDSAALLRGLIITVPVAGLVLLLLTADPAFRQLIIDITNLKLPHLPLDLLERLIISTFIIVVTAPLTLLTLKPPSRSPLANSLYSKHHLEALILTCTLCFLLGVFLIVQFPYLFTSVSESQLHRFGINTYSEYVRRGFFELSVVSAIVYASTAASYVISRAKHFSHRLLNTLNLILLSETLIFILSIFRRLFLYVGSHGLTLSRLYGSIFLLTVIALTITLILRHLVKRRTPWHLAELAILLVAVFVPPLINTERLIITYSPPTVNSEIDYTYHPRLSPDAVEGWIASYHHVTTWLEANPHVLTNATLTDEQLRLLNYHQRTLDSLFSSYYQLTLVYGNQATLDFTSQARQLAPDRYPKIRNHSLLHSNFAEKAAYTKLIEAIDLNSLVTTRQTVSDLLARSTSEKPLDRSPDSPLVR